MPTRTLKQPNEKTETTGIWQGGRKQTPLNPSRFATIFPKLESPATGDLTRTKGENFEQKNRMGTKNSRMPGSARPDERIDRKRARDQGTREGLSHLNSGSRRGGGSPSPPLGLGFSRDVGRKKRRDRERRARGGGAELIPAKEGRSSTLNLSSQKFIRILPKLGVFRIYR